MCVKFYYRFGGRCVYSFITYVAMDVCSTNSTYCNVTYSGYYPLEEMDTYIAVKCVQIMFFIFICGIVVTIDVHIFRVVYKHENLQIPANGILCVIFVLDICQILFYSVVSTALIAFHQKVWLTKMLGKTISFFLFFIINLRHLVLMLASIEKFAYCKFPFKHSFLFTNRKTLFYLFTLLLLSVIVNIVMQAVRVTIFIPSLFLFWIDFNDTETQNGRFVMLLRGVVEHGSLIVAVLFQMGILLFSLKKSKQIHFSSIRNDKNILKRMFKNAMCLFGVIIADIGGLVVTVLIMNNDGFPKHPLAQRFCVIYFIFSSCMMNPLLVIIGNVPLRRAVMKIKSVPTWLKTVPSR